MTPEYANILSKWQGSTLKWPHSFKLIYKATKDGDNAE